MTVDEKTFPAHKVVLASSSPYFHAMFNGFEESRQNRVLIQDVASKALELILKYIYTAEVLVDEETVQVIFQED